MSNRSRRIAWTIGVLLLLLFAARFVRSLDPVYAGRHLSDYLATTRGISVNYGFDPGSGTSLPFQPGVRFGSSEARPAVMAVGTNALPMLVRMLGAKNKPSRWEGWLRPWSLKFPLLGRFIRRTPLNAQEEQLQALVAFHMLGPLAAAAIPRILPLLEDRETALAASLALRYIRPERSSDILSLTNVLQIAGLDLLGQPPDRLHATALLVLSTFGTQALEALPALTNAIKSPSEQVQAAAALALARIGAPPEIAVPLIARTLVQAPAPPFPTNTANLSAYLVALRRPSGDTTLLMKVRALADYGRHASNALPALSRLPHPFDADLNAAVQSATVRITGDPPDRPSGK